MSAPPTARTEQTLAPSSDPSRGSRCRLRRPLARSKPVAPSSDPSRGSRCRASPTSHGAEFMGPPATGAMMVPDWVLGRKLELDGNGPASRPGLVQRRGGATSTSRWCGRRFHSTEGQLVRFGARLRRSGDGSTRSHPHSPIPVRCLLQTAVRSSRGEEGVDSGRRRLDLRVEPRLSPAGARAARIWQNERSMLDQLPDRVSVSRGVAP